MATPHYITSNEIVKVRGFIYFVLAPDVNRIKIGFTQKNNPLRLRALKGQSPIDIKLLYVMEGTRLIESELHNNFRAYHHHGEWFDYSDEIKSFLEAWIRISPNDPKRHDLAP